MLFLKVLPLQLLIVSLFVLPGMQRHAAAQSAIVYGGVADADLRLRTKVLKAQQVSGVPTRIIIPDVGIDVSVVPGNYNVTSAVWSVANYQANYATNTALSNNYQGKTLIYGHWTQQVFGPTKNLKAGNEAYVYTENGHLFKYVFVSSSVVSPSDIHVISQLSGKPGLVLLTCQGFHAQERRLMYFRVEQAE